MSNDNILLGFLHSCRPFDRYESRLSRVALMRLCTGRFHSGFSNIMTCIFFRPFCRLPGRRVVVNVKHRHPLSIGLECRFPNELCKSLSNKNKVRRYRIRCETVLNADPSKTTVVRTLFLPCKYIRIYNANISIVS